MDHPGPRAATGPAPLVDPSGRLDDRSSMSNYWPWWAGAIGLALITINYTVATDRSFGVSAAWDRVVHWRAERRVERVEDQFTDQRALADALAAATAEHFATARAGTSVAPYAGPDDGPAHPLQVRAPAHAPAPVGRPRPVPLVSQAALLLSIFLGGWAAAVTAGRFDLRLDMGDGFRDIVTNSPIEMTGALFLGGMLVGFGSRLAGGCSSGHGLSGCGRLYPVSLLATAVFFGVAVLVSFLLWKVI
jgi:uncharacterized protein